MSSMTLVVLAYALVWAVVTGYLVILTLRVSRLECEIRDLRSRATAETGAGSGDLDRSCEQR